MVAARATNLAASGMKEREGKSGKAKSCDLLLLLPWLGGAGYPLRAKQLSLYPQYFAALCR